MKKRRKKLNQGLTEIRPKHRVPADLSRQAPNNSYSPPAFYEDFEFACAECGKVETWTAEQQKQYYEVWKKPIYGAAKHCRECRRKRREEKASQRERSEKQKHR